VTWCLANPKLDERDVIAALIEFDHYLVQAGQVILEIMRSLKRYITRQLFRTLAAAHPQCQCHPYPSNRQRCEPHRVW
jgi:hypothetical protein